MLYKIITANKRIYVIEDTNYSYLTGLAATPDT